jgi:hypothetical protein
MNMNKEKWINEVMNSLDGVKPAGANPFLYDRILGRIRNAEAAYASPKLVWLAAASLALLIALNVFIIQRSGNSKTSDVEQLATSMQLINTSTINYN